MNVRYGQQCVYLPLYVVEGGGPTLLGRSWLNEIRLDWGSMRVASVVAGLPIWSAQEASGTTPCSKKGSSPPLKPQPAVTALLAKYNQVFEEGLEIMNSFEAELHLKPGCRPKFCKARPVPFAILGAVERELERLEKAGVVEKVERSTWAAPVVPVPKNDGHIRLCDDYKITINADLEVDKYPLPKPDDLFASLAGGKTFSIIDLTHAYQQMPLKEASRDLVTINTHKGLYRYTRLPFGVASAPSIFQRVMDTVLQGLQKVVCYLDDILITGSTEEEHLHNLEAVLKRLSRYGIRAKRAKCSFMAPAVEYLGHRIDASGLHTTDEKVRAIVQAPAPENVHELRAFLGLLHYYGKFIPHLATLLHPLNKLLKRGEPWVWSESCKVAFQTAKARLVEAPVLAHYDPALPIKLACDASSYGIGAVISHTLSNGDEQPVAFASRTLSSSERNYAQIQKEALALVYGVQKFRQYLYGRLFTLVTDHRPLTTILGPKNAIPTLAAARLQHWALILSAYTYRIEFRPTAQHANADMLSRLPLRTPQDTSVVSTFTIGQIQALPVTTEQLESATRQGSLLSKVHAFVRDGWPSTTTDGFQPYWSRRIELSTEGGCLLWGNRVVVPHKLRAKVIQEVHPNHPGMSRMKAVARSYVWWPGMDRDVENCVKSCSACQQVQNLPAKAPLHPWGWPQKPWQRVHVDFAGPFMGRYFLLAIDAHSKWPEILEMRSTTAAKTISELRKMFAAHGCPEQLVSDNGPQFVSQELATFLKMNGVKHIRCAPYHPASNGAAERLVQTFKKAMKAGVTTTRPVEQALSSFLLSYRTTPHSTTGVSPCELFLGRRLRTRLDLLLPDIRRKVTEKQLSQKIAHDRHASPRGLLVGQRVMARNMRPGERWVPATVLSKQGPVSYLVQRPSGEYWKRHIDHLRVWEPSLLGEEEGEEVESSPSAVWEGGSVERNRGCERGESEVAESGDVSKPEAPNAAGDVSRYPRRTHSPPERFM